MFSEHFFDEHHYSLFFWFDEQNHHIRIIYQNISWQSNIR